MAVTSIWRVKGWLGKVVVYVENPEKTTNPQFYEKAEMTERECQCLDDVIAYASNCKKTQQAGPEEEVVQRFVSGVNCFPATARTEMMAVKKRFGKEDRTIAYHGYQSFAPGEATPEIAHQIGVEQAKRLWGDRYQVVIATHLDKENHLHNHNVMNTVAFVDGIKFHRTEKDYREMRSMSDTLCREYGLSVIENPQHGKGKHYGEWRAEQEQRPTWRGLVRTDVDEAIRGAMTERQFFENLHQNGYEVKVGKDISVRPPGKPRFVRLARNFGEEYTMNRIRKRILEQSRLTRPLPEPARKEKQYRVSGDWKGHKKVTGFRALYLHYCNLLGVFPKGKSQNRKRLHFLLREDLIKLENITQEARLLAVHHIDTAEQLSSYRNELEMTMEMVASQRKQLYRIQRTVAVKSDKAEYEKVSSAISGLSDELCQLRKDVRLCVDIEIRSGIMREHTHRVRQDENSQRKGKQGHEQLRRCGGTNRYCKEEIAI